ncbi:hypothetical protein [Shimazuella kribbensis]|uniref:hypothetical protein n=1 Tax=Shimazuella kribbensis TaxID=139808 RepID=UPI00042818BC|nr:hypothetical protein [Shimazuella kribbensis]
MHTFAMTVENKPICFREDPDGLFTITEDGKEYVYVEESVAFFLFWIKATLDTDKEVFFHCTCCGQR